MTGLDLELSRVHGIVVKKALLTNRKLVQTIVQLVFPGFFALLTIFSKTKAPEDNKEPPLTLNILPFGRTHILYTDGRYSSKMSVALANLYNRQFCTCHSLELVRLKNTETFDNFTTRRITELGTHTYIKKMIIGMEIVEASSRGRVSVIAYYNTQPYHAEAISVNYVVNALLQFTLNTSFYFKSAIAPLPLTSEEDENDGTVEVVSYGLAASSFIAFAMSFASTLFIAAPIKERQSGTKHMEMMTGVSPFTYWLSTLAFDFILFMIASLVIPIVFALYDIQAYTGDGRWALVILVLALYGWAVLPLIYLLQFLFTSRVSGIALVLMLSFVSGMSSMLTTGAQKSKLLLQNPIKIMDLLFALLFPMYNLVYCLGKIDLNYVNTIKCQPLQPYCQDQGGPCCKETCLDQCLVYESDYTSLQHPGIGLNLICMVVQGLMFFLLVMAVEYKEFEVVWYAFFASDSDAKVDTDIKEDSDVAAERHRINSTPISTLTSTDSLVLVNLYKRYQNFVAVNRVCVGIPDGECFGLLGQNGAGKSTTFKILTGNIILTGGNAYLKGFDVKNHIKQVQSNLGYCPQFDPLIDELTAREMLTMHARLRGIPEDNIGHVVESLTDFIMLREFLDEFCGYLSGGNRRKVSTALALIGNPPFVMLDEPSSAMDPEARRNLWTVLSKIRASGRTLILTSHSMEECDALCTRIAIMVNGSFKCLGSPQHLKNKFGQGYTLIMKLGTLEDGKHTPSLPIVSEIQTHFPSAVVFDDHEGYIHLQVPDANVKIADIFSLMEDIKQTFQLEDYSVHQTTLEQVFLSFTKRQKDNLNKQA
ncbi:hypothetical protein BsWGS_13835 [Bradybaena similaris]